MSSVDSWEEAWRLARTQKEAAFLVAESRRRGNPSEATIGLLRSTFPRPCPDVDPDTGEAESGGDASVEALSDAPEWWD